MKNHIFFSHHQALRGKCGKRFGIFCRNSVCRYQAPPVPTCRYLQGTGFPYLCKGKIKAATAAGEFSGKMT